MRNEKSEVGNEDCECSLPISHMACTDILGEIELDPEKWEMRLKRESPSLKFPPQFLLCGRQLTALFVGPNLEIEASGAFCGLK